MLARGELWAWIAHELPTVFSAGPLVSLQAFGYWSAAGILVAFGPLSLMMASTTYMVVQDSLKCRHVAKASSATKNDCTRENGESDECVHPFGLLRCIGLAIRIWSDYTILGQ